MIFGDPFKFALQFDTVKEWNDTDSFWCNGLFSLYLDGKRLFEEVDVVELKTIKGFFSNLTLRDHVKKSRSITANELFSNAYGYFWKDQDNLMDGVSNMTSISMSDFGLYIYLLRDVEFDRLVWSINTGENVNETYLPAGTVETVLNLLSEPINDM